MRNSKRPLVSVIIPAYNAAQFIERALASAQRQTYQHTEIIVVDDGSGDETAALVEAVAARDARVQLLRQPNRGVAAARNHAIAQAQGTFIAPLDADDLWFPRKLERQVQRMVEAGPSAGLVYAWWVAVNEEDDILGAADRWTVEGHAYEALLFRNFIGNASVPLFRRACLEHVGAYDPTLKARGGQGCEDWDLTLRVAEHYDVRYVPAYLSGYRAVEESMSANVASMGRSYDLVVDAIERRHPGLAPELFRWSRSNFYFYLASFSYNAGRFRQALYWLGKAVRADPPALLSTWGLKTALKSAFRYAARPLTSLLWPERQDWLRFKRQMFPEHSAQLSLSELREDPTSVPEPWAWRSWKPYDRLCLWRWERVTEGGADFRRQENRASRPGPAPRHADAREPAPSSND